ncbi:MAG: acylphosphatase [Candidatus Eisenbacteria bacterium]|nr:acylphosphatase [Candidatus Eisenbacteria bacterium]
MNEREVRKRVIVSGRVQGVGFRYHARRAAENHDVSGFVRNLDDGSVEVEAQGLPAEVDAFLAEVRRGPHGSRVIDFRAEPAPLEPEARGFRIRY